MFRRKIGVMLLIFFGLSLLCGCSNQAKETAENEFSSVDELVEFIRVSTVMVTAGEKHASGLILGIDEKEVTIVTAGHLMEGFNQGIITFSTGNAGFGDVRFVSENPDLCIMTFGVEYVDESLLNELRPVRIDLERFESLSEGDAVYLCGSAISTGSNATTGKIASTNYYMSEYDAWMIYIYADVMAGMSGCGVYDENACLMGILCAGNDGGEAVAVKLSDILDKWEEMKND